MNDKKFSVKGFTFELEEILQNSGAKVSSVRSFWQDDHERINIQFEDEPEQTTISRMREVDDLVEAEEIPAKYTINAFYQDGGISVQLTFNSDEDKE